MSKVVLVCLAMLKKVPGTA